MDKKNKLPRRGKVKVIFHNNEGPGGKKPVVASLNGEAIRIPREQEVIIDVRYLHGALKDTLNVEFEKTGDGLAGERKVLRYPYTLVEVVEDLDIRSEAPKKAKTDLGEDGK